MADRFEDFDSPEEAHYYSLLRVANALRDLGNGNAATDMGAIEAHGQFLQEGLHRVAEAISDLADAIRMK